LIEGGKVFGEAIKTAVKAAERGKLVTFGVWPDKPAIGYGVETHDGLMITTKDQDQAIKKIVAQLKYAGRPETELHHKAFRPWGNYDRLDGGERFQVKRITVKAGEATSLQKYFHRAEHWIVVSGTAEVTCGDHVFTLKENEAAHIPAGEKHRLGNPGEHPLEIIEVQCGNYLGEDDIVRFDDEYGRV